MDSASSRRTSRNSTEAHYPVSHSSSTQAQGFTHKSRRRRSTESHSGAQSRSSERLTALQPLQPMDSDWPRRISSSPQLVRTTRARSSSASSSASLTATEDNYKHLSQRSSAASSSSSRLGNSYPAAWVSIPQSRAIFQTPPAQSSTDDGTDDSENARDPEDVIYFARHPSASTSSSLRPRRVNGRRREVENTRLVTTARGQPCAGETETEFDEMVSLYIIIDTYAMLTEQACPSTNVPTSQCSTRRSTAN